MSAEQSDCCLNKNQDSTFLVHKSSGFIDVEQSGMETADHPPGERHTIPKLLTVIAFFFCVTFIITFCLYLSSSTTACNASPSSTTSPSTPDDINSSSDYGRQSNNLTPPAVISNIVMSKQPEESTKFFNSTLDPLYDSPVSQILRQYDELQNLGCKPTQKKVSVLDFLDPEEKVKEENIEPKRVVLTKCYEDCTFCLGENEQCLPTAGGERTKEVTVAIGGENLDVRFRTLVLTEHVNCACSVWKGK